MINLRGPAAGSFLILAGLVLAGCGSEGDQTDDSAASAPSASAVVPDQPTDRALGAASWLTHQFEGGLLVGEYGPDYGLSIDAALGLAALPEQDETVAAVSDAVAGNIAGYTTGVDFGTEDTYAGSVAKSAVLAQVAGDDPTSFGGTDLVQELERLIADDGAAKGRLGDDVVDPKGTDYANVIGQAYAVRALAESGSAEAESATDYLLDQQCDEGWFRLYFAARDADDQSCDAGSEQESVSDTDVTAHAVLALADQAGDEDVDEAIERAVAWLLKTQLDDGGFGGATSTEGPNVNSTGLSGLALLSQGETEAATRAAEWAAALQVTDLPCAEGKLATETGAVAYNADTLAAGMKQGLRKPATVDEWRRATAQAVPVLMLAGDPVEDVTLEVASAEGGQVVVEVTGLGDGESACLTAPGGTPAPVEGDGATITADVMVPSDADQLLLHRLAGTTTTDLEAGTGP